MHPARQKEIDRGLRELLEVVPERLRGKLAPRYDMVRWEELSLDEIAPYLREIDEKCAKRIEFTLRMNDLTTVAVSVMSGENLTVRDLKVLKREGITARGRKELIAAVVNRQHELLRDLYEVSTPKLEMLRDAALSAGALAVKISGAGLGGCLVAIPDEDVDRVIRACLDAGATRVWLCRVDRGVCVERIS